MSTEYEKIFLAARKKISRPTKVERELGAAIRRWWEQ